MLVVFEKPLIRHMKPYHAPAHLTVVAAIAGVAIESFGRVFGSDLNKCGRVSWPGRSHIASCDPAKELILRLRSKLDKGGAGNSLCLGIKRIKRLAIHWEKRLKISIKLAKNIVSGAPVGAPRILVGRDQSIHKRTQRGAVYFGQHSSLSLWRKKQVVSQSSMARAGWAVVREEAPLAVFSRQAAASAGSL